MEGGGEGDGRGREVRGKVGSSHVAVVGEARLAQNMDEKLPGSPRDEATNFLPIRQGVHTPHSTPTSKAVLWS